MPSSSRFACLFVVVGMVFAACDVGDLTQRTVGSVDASGGGPPSVGTPDAGSGGSTPACKDIVSTQASGEHNAGAACLGCHSAGGGAPVFTVGGTLYGAATGGAPVVGATITITDATGKTVDLISAQNGNFWSTDTIAYPATVYASGCPNVATMQTALAAGGGDCNSCHTAAAAEGRVHLP